MNGVITLTENCNEATEKICSTLKCIATDIAETDDEPPCDTASIKIIEKSGSSSLLRQLS